MKEQSVFEKVKAELDRIRRYEPLWWFRTHGGGRTKIGLPDIHVTYFGRSVWIELKRPGKSASKIQKQRIKEIRAAGGVAFVADCIADVQSGLAEALESVGIVEARRMLGKDI